jgi:hypothetical protein
MSESMREKLIRFVADLKKDKKVSWEQVAERCRERFPNAEGVSLTANAVRKRYNARLKELETFQPVTGSKESEMISAEVKEQLRQELIEAMEDYVEERVQMVIERVSAQVAERVFDEKIAKLQNVPTIASSEGDGYPPAPPMPETVQGSRRHAFPRGKIAGTVDAALLELFEKERKERGCNVSRMLDIVLWNYFGHGKCEKPKMSFELSEPSENQA